MIATRRLSLQLTPLLDLLLIVIFAQYLEVRSVAKQEVEQVETQRQAAIADTDLLRQQLADLQHKLDEWEAHSRASNRIEHANKEQLGQLFGELFHIPEATIQRIAKQRSQDQAGLSPAEIAVLRKEFQALATARGDQVVDHLLTFTEMKKRFDVWELYIEDNGALIVSSGSHRKRLQTGIIETPEQFSDELFRIYKTFPQTKSVVLILVSYGDARLLHRLAVIKGLPEVTERMRLDSNGTARFEYAVLGFRPDAAPRP
jgi:regulator of replication initiation timing